MEPDSVPRSLSEFWCTESFRRPSQHAIRKDQPLLVTDVNPIRKPKNQWNMEHRISTLFYARKSKKNSGGLAPVYMRITVNGQRLEQSIQRFVDPAQWSAAAGRLKGNTTQARQLNLYLDTLSSKVLQM